MICAKFSKPLINKENPAVSITTGFILYGGRYKTRTCDLPHVKRMRYQLRQSSVFHRQRLFYLMPMNLSTVFFSFSHKPCIGRFFHSTRG